jgi:hypothetical protein
MILGIDPGKEGAFVLLSQDGKLIDFEIMPLGPDGQPDYMQIKICIRSFFHRTTAAYLERAMPMAMGAGGAFTYGMGFAAIKIALREVGMPYTMIEPSKWTKEIFQGIDSNLKPKAQGLIAIDRLFPEEKEKIPVSPRAKNLHGGVIDALLIAEYGRRSLLKS